MSKLRNVYDLFYLSPPPLQETASIQIALGLWRQEIRKQSINNTLNDFEWPSNLPLSTLIPNAPPGILPIIEKYVKIVGESMKNWLSRYILNDIFEFEILNCFDDFVCDLDGKIHGERTARRMIMCDEISDETKFYLACWYCFEDDINKFWPSVSSDVDLDGRKIHNYTCIVYWICYLRNDKDYISIDFYDYDVDTLEEKLVNELLIFGTENWPAIRYFWNRLDSDVQIRCLTRNYRCFFHNGEIIIRYILAQLNDEQLQELCRERFTDLCSTLRYQSPSCIEVWSLIEHKLDKVQFVGFIRSLVESYTETTDELWNLLEIWTSAPNDLKLFAIPEILLNRPIFEISTWSNSELMKNKNVCFLLAMLSDASIEDRMTFWNKNWRNLLMEFGTKEFRCVINLCLRSEVEINLFKSSLVSDYENIRLPCQKLLRQARFEELDEFLKFYCQNEQTIQEIKINELANNFIINSSYIAKPFLLNCFIEDAYNDVNLANEFKNELLMSSQTISALKRCIRPGDFQLIIDFVDTLAPSEEIADQVKNRDILPSFTSWLKNESNRRKCADNMADFMRWCLGSDEGIEQFKQSFSVDELMLHLIAAEKGTEWEERQYCDNFGRPEKPLKWDSFLVTFLQWYFVTKEDFEAFRERYAGHIRFSEDRINSRDFI